VKPIDNACSGIVNGEMRLNDAVMILKWYGEWANKFPVIDGDAFDFRPNHIHCTVGADLRVRPDHIDDNHDGSTNRSA